MDAITKAPIIDHFSGTVAGCTTIRCFEKQDQFSTLNVERVNSNIRMDFHNNAANEWLGLRLEMIGSIILCFSALLLVTLPRSMVNPGKAPELLFPSCRLVDPECSSLFTHYQLRI